MALSFECKWPKLLDGLNHERKVPKNMTISLIDRFTDEEE